MKKLRITNPFIKGHAYEGNEEIEEVEAVDAVAILSTGAFKNCTNLKDIYFGLDITRIGHGTFEGCTSLKDVWFAIIDEDKIIEIADDAFRDLTQPITFHIFASAVKNKYLNEYAKKHGFKVEGML